MLERSWGEATAERKRWRKCRAKMRKQAVSGAALRKSRANLRLPCLPQAVSGAALSRKRCCPACPKP